MSKAPICYFPFYQVLLQPTGDVAPCCWNQKIKWGNIKNETLNQIWNGPEAVRLRQEFLDGNPVTCKNEIKYVGCHKKSIRNFDTELTAIKTQMPKRFDVRLNGKCNLQCVMCDVWQQPNGVYEDTDFWKQGPRDYFPFLREVDILGGEPFIQRDTFRLISEVQNVTSDCSWAFVTNGNFKLNQSLREKLDGIQIRWIQISLDTIKNETYKKIRVKGKFELVMETVDEFIKYRNRRILMGHGFKLFLSICVQKDNWRELEEFILFCKAKEVAIVIQYAFEPNFISLSATPRSLQREILSYFHGLREKYHSLIDPVYFPLQDGLAEDPTKRTLIETPLPI